MIQQQLHYQQVESDLHLETTTFVGVVGLTPVVVVEADSALGDDEAVVTVS